MHRFMIVLITFAVLSQPEHHDKKKLVIHDQWPQWRGPLNTGVAPNGKPPVSWSEDKNIRWKIAIPGNGHSTPIVWGDRIFVTTAIPFGGVINSNHDHAPGAHDNFQSIRQQNFVILAINRKDGSILWQRTLRSEQPHEGTHVTGSWASNSPVTDGERLYAFFGSRGLYCLTLDGDELWQKDFGDMHTRHGHGEGSSPALYQNTIIINWDHQNESFIIALDKHTGQQRWKVIRDEITSWSTPLVVEHEGVPQVIISATNRIRGYNLTDGNVIWECGGLSRNVVASPVASDGFVYVSNSYDWQAMLAIRLSDAHGDITHTKAIAWTLDRYTPYVPSPLLYDDNLYFLKHNQGFLTCVDTKTGKRWYGPKRINGIDRVFASPVGAAGRVYIVSRNGTTAVIKHGKQFEYLAKNQLDDSFSASPVIVGHELFLRGEKYLYCIADSNP